MAIPVAALPSITALVYRGTHNSYDQRRKVTVESQIDDYGVWAVELDYAILAASLRTLITLSYGNHDAWFRVPPPCVIGHDGPGVCADGAGPVFAGGPDYLLSDQLAKLASTQVSLYRPLILYLEKKKWFVFQPLPSRVDDPVYDDDRNLYSLLGAELQSRFGARLFTPRELGAFIGENNRYPTIAELARRVMAIAIGGRGNEVIFAEDLASPANPNGLFRDFANPGCGRPSVMAPIPVAPPQVWRNDNFSDSWTWDFALPPNPIIVAAGAPSRPTIIGCSEDADEVVHIQAAQQGTKLIPFRRISDAVARARGRLSTGAEAGIGQRGLGFTVLVTPGTYPEAVRIDFPLRLANRTPETGKARIGA